MSSNNQSSAVSSNQLTELVRAIVQTIVNEMYDLEEMTATGAVGAVQVPTAFSKRKVKEGDEADAVNDMWAGSDDDLAQYEVKPEKTPAQPKIQPKPVKRVGKATIDGKEIPLEEMTTTGDVSGYNVPSAFAKKGGSKKGVEGSAKLGYTLTSAGQAEMNRQGDRLLENEQPQRRQRCSKCGQLKPTDANGYIHGWECYDCRKPEPMQEKTDEKPDLYTQRKMALDKAKREKNVEAYVYYTTLMQGNSSANVDFDRFKGSWAYEQWVKNPVVAQKIADKQAELARYPYSL